MKEILSEDLIEGEKNTQRKKVNGKPLVKASDNNDAKEILKKTRNAKRYGKNRVRQRGTLEKREAVI